MNEKDILIHALTQWVRKMLPELDDVSEVVEHLYELLSNEVEDLRG
jgi:hypothetical protein